KLMKVRTVFLFGMVAALMTLQPVTIFAQQDDQGEFAQDDKANHEKGGVPGAEVFWAKGHAHSAGSRGPRSSPNLTWHGGNIMSTVKVTPIFWGPSWGNGDFTKDKMDGLQSFYTGMTNSNYAHTSDEYSQLMTDSITYVQHWVDLSAAPSSGSQVSPILAE